MPNQEEDRRMEQKTFYMIGRAKERGKQGAGSSICSLIVEFEHFDLFKYFISKVRRGGSKPTLASATRTSIRSPAVIRSKRK